MSSIFFFSGKFVAHLKYERNLMMRYNFRERCSSQISAELVDQLMNIWRVSFMDLRILNMRWS